MSKENLKIDWPGIVLATLALLSLTFYIGYWLGSHQKQQATAPTPPTEVWTKEKIAFLKNDIKSIWIMNPDGSNQQRVIAHDNFIERGTLNWSPDKAKLAYALVKYGSSGPENLELRYFNFATNESVLVHTFPYNSYIHWSSSWLKDSSGIVYAKRNEIWKYDVGRRENTLLNDQIAYTSSIKTNNNMYLQTTNNSIFFNADEYLGKIPLDKPSNIVEVVTDPAIDFFSVAPDESFVTCTTRRSDRPLYQLVIQRNLKTQEQTQLHEDYGCAGYRPGAYAPDSSRFLLHYQCGDSIEIKIYSKDGTLIRDIRSQKEGIPSHDVLWSSNGSRLFVYFTYRLWKVNFASIFDANGQGENLLDVPNIDEIVDLSWSSY